MNSSFGFSTAKSFVYFRLYTSQNGCFTFITEVTIFLRPARDITKKLARVRKFHSIFLPRARNYHWLKLPGSGNITSFFKFTPGSPVGGSVYQKIESHITFSILAKQVK